MISAEQIRGARGILNWTQDVLAHECGLSSNTIYNLERGFNNRSAEVVRTTLEKKGLQFHGTTGISIRKEEATVVYSGAEGTTRFYEDVLSTVKEQGGEIVTRYRTSEILARSLGATSEDDLDNVKRIAKYAQFRCLMSQSEDSWDVPYFQVRKTANTPLPPLSYFTYGNKHALALSSDGKSFYYYVALSAEIARVDANHFESIWLAAGDLISGK